MKNRILILALSALTFAVPGISAEQSPMPMGEIGRIAFSERLSTRLEIKNDSIASLSNSDWDDFRTFGALYGLAWKNWMFEFTADALTNRGTSEENRGRIDQLALSVSRKILSHETNSFNLEFSAGAGYLALGDFYGYEIQKSFHALIKNRRPIPINYDSPSERSSVSVHGMINFGLKGSMFPIHATTLVEGGENAFYRINVMAETGEFDHLLGFSVYGGVIRAGNYSQFGRTFSNTLTSENGVYFGARIDTGLFDAGFSYNVSTSRQAGYFALSFPPERNTTKPVDTGILRAIDCSYWSNGTTFRMRTAIDAFALPASLKLSPMCGVGSGSLYPEEYAKDETLHYRFEECYAGFDLSKTIVRGIDLYAMAAGGVRKEQKMTRTLEASTVLYARTCGLCVMECGARLFIPRSVKHGFRWGVGGGAGFRYADSIATGFRPYAQLLVIAENRRY